MDGVLIDGSPLRVSEPAAGLEKELGVSASVVSDYIAPSPARHLRHMLIATTIVAVLPLVVSLALRTSGLLSGWASVGLAVALSLAASTAGNAHWRKRGCHEVLFGELLLWGWIRRWRQERELTNAIRLLDLVSSDAPQLQANADETLTVERPEHLLRQLAGALEGQDVYLNGHSRRVARHATMIARGMGLPSEEVARVRAAAAVHDVGKLRTPKAILNKPGRLTDAEFEVITRHPVDGADMVAALGDLELARIVRHHHERLDGAGYPDRLTGDEIPLGARIIAVADTFDAITSARPYRDAAPHQKAIDILRHEAGTQLDPDAVRAFLAYYSGNRPTVIWAVITGSVRRFVAWLSGDPAAAASISAGKLAAATAATAAIGAASGAAPVPMPAVHQPARQVMARAASLHHRGAAVSHGGQLTATGVSLSPTAAARRTRAPHGVPIKAHRHRAAHAAPTHIVPKHGASTHDRRHVNPAVFRSAGRARASTTVRSAPTGSSSPATNTPKANPTPQATTTPPGHLQPAGGNARGHTKSHANASSHGSPRSSGTSGGQTNGGGHTSANANSHASGATQSSADAQGTGGTNSQASSGSRSSDAHGAGSASSENR